MAGGGGRRGLLTRPGDDERRQSASRRRVHSPKAITKRYNIAVTVTVSMSGGCICPSVISYPSITAATPALWPSGRRGQRTTTPAPALRTKCSSPWTSPMLYRWGLVGRKNAITLSFWSCSYFDNRWWWPGARSASGLIREGKPRCWARGNRHTHHDVIVRVARRAPSILVAVWAVEYPPVLPEESDEPAHSQTGLPSTRTQDRSHTHVNAGIRADEVCHGQRALFQGVLAISPDLCAI